MSFKKTIADILKSNDEWFDNVYYNMLWSNSIRKYKENLLKEYEQILNQIAEEIIMGKVAYLEDHNVEIEYTEDNEPKAPEWAGGDWGKVFLKDEFLTGKFKP